MNTSINYAANHSVYPGEYVPLPETENLFDQLSHSLKAATATAPVNMQEFENYFMLQMQVTGLRREDVLVFIRANVLSIALKNKIKAEDGITEPGGLDAFTESHTLLPENTDAEFIMATCDLGMLNVYIPKTKEPVSFQEHSVIVY